MSKPAESPTNRIASVDAYRGLAMFLMMAEVLELADVAKLHPGSRVWEWLGFNQSHVAWSGCSIHDMIQPSFSFLVGVALPFSISSRRGRGETPGKSILHAAWRSIVLVGLGIFLRSINKGRTYYTFEDTLSQIGLGYLLLFLIALMSVRARWVAIAVIVVGYWAAFAVYPVTPGSGPFTGFPAHWNKNANLAWAFDGWFLNLFPRESLFEANKGGYSTLSFISTLGTMLLGLVAGGWLQGQGSPWRKVGLMVGAGVVELGLGLAFDRLGVCPIVKRIWTPSWVLFSGGICFVVLASFYAIVDVLGFRAWTYPLKVVGRNSITAYCLAETARGPIEGAFKRHLGESFFQTLSSSHEELVLGVFVLVTFWSILYWMDRNSFYVKV